MKQLFLSLPATFNTLTKELDIPSLGIKRPLQAEKYALKLAITELSGMFNEEFSSATLEKIVPSNSKQIEDELVRFMIIIDNYDSVLKHVLDKQPIIECGVDEDKKKKKEKIENSSLILADPNEVMSYGYPYWED